jgi:hypothetical protein
MRGQSSQFKQIKRGPVNSSASDLYAGGNAEQNSGNERAIKIFQLESLVN